MWLNFYLHPYITDLQTVSITLRILFRPQTPALPKIYTNLGIDYDERVLPSITNEVLKAVVVSYRNDPKFSDRRVWANSVDPDETAPCHPVCIFLTHYSVIKRYCSNFRIITAIFRVSKILGFLRYIILLTWSVEG